MSRTFLAIDGNNLLMRAIYAVHYRRGRPEIDAEPMQTAAGALDLFVAMLGRHVRAQGPQRVALCWDPFGPSFREALSPTYKATRAKGVDHDAQDSAFALAKEFAYLAGIPNVAAAGLEADDLIAGFWRGADPQRVDKLVILSSDRDFAQLVGETPQGIEVEQINPSGKRTESVTTREVEATWGCRPDQLPLVKALAGDSSDNVIGVKGIGPKKAVKKLAEADWDFGVTIRALADDAKVECNEDDAARLRVNLRLVDLRSAELALPLPPLFVAHTAGHPHAVRAAEMLSRYDLERHASQLSSGSLWEPRQDDLPGAPLDLAQMP